MMYETERSAAGGAASARDAGRVLPPAPTETAALSASANRHPFRAIGATPRTRLVPGLHVLTWTSSLLTAGGFGSRPFSGEAA
jgi:hypothetical protein